MSWYESLSKAKKLIENGQNDEAKDILKEHLENLKSGEISLGKLETALYNYTAFLEFAYNNSNRSDLMLQYIKHALNNLEDIKTCVNHLQETLNP